MGRGTRGCCIALTVLVHQVAGAVQPVPAVDTAAARESTWHYTVLRGDTLYGLVRTHCRPGTSWMALQRLNRVHDPRRLQPGLILKIPTAWLLARATLAEIIHVQGNVELWRAGARERVQVGMQVGDGDRLSSGEGAAVSLRLADGSRVLLRPRGELKLDEHVLVGASGAVRSRIRLNAGELDVRVPPSGAKRQLEVETPSAHLGVRGTDFRTHVDDVDGGQTRLEVLHGQVAARALAATTASVHSAAKRGRTDSPRAASGGRVVEAGQGLRLAQSGSGPVVALLAAPVLGGLPARVERLPLRFEWVDLAGAHGYRAQVFAVGDPDALLLDGLATEASARWADLPDGRYELRVRGRDADGFEGRDARHVFTLKARPQPPFTRSPAPGARVWGSPTRLSWTQAHGAARYHLQIARADAFDAPLVDLQDVRDTEHAAELPPGRYHWRLATVRGDGDHGPFGDAQVFEQRAIPPAPGAATAESDEGGLRVRWPAAAAGTRYQLQLARDASFAAVLADMTTEQAQAVLGVLEPGRYHLRVRSLDPDGFAGPWGAAQSIEVPSNRWWLLLVPLLLLAL
jgi:hypothetical protein